MFLSPDEIERLTGYKRAAAQRRWLVDRGYRFDIDGRGRPVVATAAVEARLGVKSTGAAQPRWEKVGQEA